MSKRRSKKLLNVSSPSYTGVREPEWPRVIYINKEFSPLDFRLLGCRIIAMIAKVTLLEDKGKISKT